MGSDLLMEIRRPKSGCGLNSKRESTVDTGHNISKQNMSEPINNNTLDKKINFYNIELDKLKLRNAQMEEREKNFRFKEREQELKYKAGK